MTEVLQGVKTISKIFYMWFIDNEVMANADKCHLLSSDEDHTIEINEFTIYFWLKVLLLSSDLDVS